VCPERDRDEQWGYESVDLDGISYTWNESIDVSIRLRNRCKA
jgi:hypothetical protein